MCKYCDYSETVDDLDHQDHYHNLDFDIKIKGLSIMTVTVKCKNCSYVEEYSDGLLPRDIVSLDDNKKITKYDFSGLYNNPYSYKATEIEEDKQGNKVVRKITYNLHDEWVVVSKEEDFVNKNNVVLSKEINKWDIVNDEYLPCYYLIEQYDENGDEYYQESSSSWDKNNNEWIDKRKEEKKYDSKGNIISVLIYESNSNDEWVLENKRTYEYDADKIVIEYCLYYFSYSYDGWICEKSGNIYYNDLNDTEDGKQIFLLVDGNWIPIFKSETTIDGYIKTTITKEYSKESGTYNLYSKKCTERVSDYEYFNFTYISSKESGQLTPNGIEHYKNSDTNGKIVIAETFKKSDGGKTFVPLNGVVYTNDDGVTDTYFGDISLDNDGWLTYHRWYCTYNDQGNVSNQIVYDLSNNVYNAEFNYCEYDEDGFIYKKTKLFWKYVDGQWVYDAKRIFEKDSVGLLRETKEYKWDQTSNTWVETELSYDNSYFES